MTRRVAILLVVVLPLAGFAHDADVVYVAAQSTPEPGTLVEVITLTGAALGALAPVDADGDGLLSQADLDARAAAISAGVWDDMPLGAGGQPCARERTKATLKEGYVELVGHFRCGEGELRQDFKILRVLPANFRVVLGSQLEGEVGKAFAHGQLTALTVPRPPPPGAFSRARFENGLADGVGAVAWIGALGGLLLVLGAAGSWRSALLGWALCGAGVLGGAFLPTPEWVALAVLGAGAVALASRGTTHATLGLAAGVALTARMGGGPVSYALGVGVGALAALVVAGPAAVAAGRLLQRRPTGWKVARWAAAAAVCFAVGFRVAA
ncbi:MAG: hypothetical protein AMXMBFR34_31780 [Myxococcaceae bacterium]